MRSQNTGKREQGTEELAALLRNAVPPLEPDAEPRDLWPHMQARLYQHGDVAEGIRSVPWFDWALAGGMGLLAVAFPAAIPVLLYYL